MRIKALEMLNKNLLTIEHKLSYAGLFPITVIPGAIKAGMGIIQTITSIAISILLILPSIFVKMYNPNNDTCGEVYTFLADQLLNGLGNIIAGSLESIPFVGMIGFFCLSRGQSSISIEGKIINYSYTERN